MSKIKIIFILFLSVLIWGSVILFGYYSSQWTNREYKDSAKQLEKLIARIGRRIDQGVDKRKAAGQDDHIWKEYKYAVSSVEKHKDEWKTASEGLEKIIRRAPKSKYADDAAFCLALEYTVLSATMDRASTANPYRDIAKEKRDKFIHDYPGAKIDDWTKNRLKEVFWDNFEKESGELFNMATPISSRLYGILVIEEGEALLRSYQLDKAEILYTGIKNDFPNDPISKFADEKLNYILRM